MLDRIRRIQQNFKIRGFRGVFATGEGIAFSIATIIALGLLVAAMAFWSGFLLALATVAILACFWGFVTPSYLVGASSAFLLGSLFVVVVRYGTPPGDATPVAPSAGVAISAP